MNWINIKDKAPRDGQSVIYYFEPLGMCLWGNIARWRKAIVSMAVVDSL